MKDIFNISKLVIKKKLKILTDSEKSRLKQFNKDYPFLKDLNFESLVDRISDYAAINTDAAWEAILGKSNKRKLNAGNPFFRESWFKYAAAAILVVALASTYFLRDSIFNNQTENTTPVIVNNKIEKGTDKATLTLEDGSTVILEKGATYQTQNANSNGEQIVYQQQSSSRAQSSSSRAQSRDNTLTIPRGGQFFAQLSDGTKVWLNSESQLKYPVAFVAGESRQVELVYGEAYFEVSPSTDHKGANFKVFNKSQEIEVLGTKFNIKAYKDENNIYTTLVEGKVAVKHESKTQNLEPNQQSNLNITTNKLAINKIDAIREIAWVNGEFILQGKNLKEIMKVLSRWYDMEVTFANKALENERFIGVLGKEQDIVEILNAIKSFGVIKDYEINNKKVILK